MPVQPGVIALRSTKHKTATFIAKIAVDRGSTTARYTVDVIDSGKCILHESAIIPIKR